MPTYTYPSDLSTTPVGTWVAGQSYVTGSVVVPTAFGSSLYKNLGAAGISGSAEPVWPGSGTVLDGTVTWTQFSTQTITWKASATGTSGATEPVWPTTLGGTVVDGEVTWTAINKNIKDTNCPNTTAVASAAGKIFAVNGANVQFSATDNPTDWTSSSDAGFLPIGMQAVSDQIATALGLYRGNLVVMMPSGIQIWQIDPDPSKMALLDYLNGYGTPFARSQYSTIDDMYFLTTLGIRSISVSAGTANMNGGDVGTPIDKVFQAFYAGSLPNYDPIGYYYAGMGQYWLINANTGGTTTTVFVLTQSQVAQLSEWSQYIFPVLITDVTTLDGIMYIKDSNGWVYTLVKDYYTDDIGNASHQIPTVTAQTLYLNLGQANIVKQLIGIDAVADGTSTSISVGMDETDFTQESAAITVIADTTTGGMIPIPCAAISLSFLMTHQLNENWEFYSLGIFYNTLRTWR